jgi:hypothetical protein
MIDALKTLFENDVVSEEIRAQIEEAWDSKVRENKMELASELREEFAQKYEHDKQNMVEAIDQMLEERLAAEISEFQEDRKGLAEAKAKYAIAMRENADLLKNFVVGQLQSEITELRADKVAMQENYAKLEEFVVDALSNEIAEFYEDKKDLAETKVRLVREAKTHFAKVKKDFIERSATTVSETVSKALKAEIASLKEDIDVARENDFGRKLFEAFAAEYSTSYLNEKSETAKLLKVVDIKDKQLAEAKATAEKAIKIAEAKEVEKKRLVESATREKSIRELVAPLSNEQREIMTDLLESVQTARLQSAFDKYLPAVIDGKGPAKQKAVLSEAKEITGNRDTQSQTNVSSKADDGNVLDIRRLAGLN